MKTYATNVAKNGRGYGKWQEKGKNTPSLSEQQKFLRQIRE